jgi:hypothetical protein
MTVISIATQIIINAYQAKYDTAMQISAIANLVPTIQAVHDNFFHKMVLVVFTPKHHNNSTVMVANDYLIIGEKNRWTASSNSK